MHDGMVRMGRIAVIVLDFRVDMDPWHHEQPEGDPEEKGSARPGRTFTHRWHSGNRIAHSSRSDLVVLGIEGL